jgi:hypothetical protein
MTQAARHILETAISSVSQVGAVVEIGPGWGVLAKECGRRGFGYVAVDANLGLLKGLEGVGSVCSFAPPIPLRDGVCDVAIASHVIEHANSLPEAQGLISEMRRILHKKGCVILVAPDVLWRGKYFWDCDYSHNFPTSSRRLCQMVCDQGLEIAKVEYLYNHLTGLLGYAAGRIINWIPYRWPGCQPNSAFYSERIYKARMTFSRSVLIVARVP